MNRKTYAILMIATLIIGVLLLFYLPEDKRLYVFFLPIVMWIVYSILIAFEKRKADENNSRR